MKRAKILYVISFILFLVGQGMNFGPAFQLLHIFSIALVIYSGLMVYKESESDPGEAHLFTLSFALLLIYSIYTSIFGFVFNLFIEIFLYIVGFSNIFFLFRVLSLRIRKMNNN